jgi:hypothetical protein
VRLKALLVSIGCALVLVSCASAKTIAPASLVISPTDLPGFATAKMSLQSTSSATRYDEGQATALKRQGFQQGVLETLTKGRSVALSQAAVFGTAHGASEALKAEVAPLIVKPTADVRFAVPGVPGVFAVLELNLQDTPGYLQNADVLFSTGRCLEHLATAVVTPRPYSTTRQVDGAVIAGAVKLYRQVKTVCA